MLAKKEKSLVIPADEETKQYLYKAALLVRADSFASWARQVLLAEAMKINQAEEV